MASQKEVMGILRSRAAGNLQSWSERSKASRGINSKTTKVWGWVRGRHGQFVESYRLDKFISRIILNGKCWQFEGASRRTGYGQFLDSDGRVKLAHRLSYEWFVGKIKPELVIDHLCRNRACVNPDHLRQTTHKENILCGVGAPAFHAVKTHCYRGHPFSPENTYKTKHGRSCRTCRKALRRKHYLKSKKQNGGGE
jgi:hypothetical protein